MLYHRERVDNVSNSEAHRWGDGDIASAPGQRSGIFYTVIGYKAGNVVYSSQLKKRVNYNIMYGSENPEYATTGQFVIQDRICPKAVSVPVTATASVISL